MFLLLLGNIYPESKAPLVSRALPAGRCTTTTKRNVRRIQVCQQKLQLDKIITINGQPACTQRNKLSKVLEDLRPKIAAVPRGTCETHEENIRGRCRSCKDIISQGFLCPRPPSRGTQLKLVCWLELFLTSCSRLASVWTSQNWSELVGSDLMMWCTKDKNTSTRGKGECTRSRMSIWRVQHIWGVKNESERPSDKSEGN